MQNRRPANVSLWPHNKIFFEEHNKDYNKNEERLSFLFEEWMNFHLPELLNL